MTLIQILNKSPFIGQHQTETLKGYSGCSYSQIGSHRFHTNLLNYTNIQKNYLTNLQRAEFILTQKEKEIVVGLLLGDLNAQKYPPAMLGALPHR
jgi:hypothetical protein